MTLIGASSQAAEFHVQTIPPARFDHAHSNMAVRYLSPSEVDKLCRRIGAKAPFGLAIKGCAKGGPTACAIVIPLNDRGTIFRHERAHCNGWAADHHEPPTIASARNR
jgi:hypothetical protein